MPVRAADIDNLDVCELSTYPRHIDFPLKRGYSRHTLLLDHANIDENIMTRCNFMEYNIAQNDTIIVCRYESTCWKRREHCSTAACCTVKNQSSSSNSMASFFGRGEFCFNYVNGVIHVSGQPFYIEARSDLVVKDVSKLSCVLANPGHSLALLPGWTREEVADICTAADPQNIIVSDWVTNHDQEHVRLNIYYLRFITILQMYKVTNDETGRGYVEVILE